MANERFKVGDDHGLVTEEAKPRLKRPPLYRVILLNDDYTPMEFVVDVLEKFFHWTATRRPGSCWRFTRRVKASAACSPTRSRRPKSRRSRARSQHQHPLLCTMEEA